MRLRFHVYALCAVLFLSGCAALKQKEAEKRPSRKAASLRAEASVVLKKIIPIGGHAVIIVKSPDKFRIEVFGPFGQVMALLASDGTSFYMFSGDEAKKMDMDDPAFPYPFKAKEAVSFLLGSPSGQFAQAALDGGVKAGDREMTSDSEGRLAKFVKYKKGRPAFTVELSDYRAVSGVDLPFNISIKGQKEGLSIKYASVEIDPEIDPDAFNIGPLP